MKTEHKLVDTAKAMLRGNHDNENLHMKSREDEAHNLKTLLSVSENNKLNRKLVDGKNEERQKRDILPSLYLIAGFSLLLSQGSGNWLSSSSHSPLNLPPSASLLTSHKETVPTSANDLSRFPQLVPQYSGLAPKATFPIQPFLTCAPSCRQRIWCKNRFTTSRLRF